MRNLTVIACLAASIVTVAFAQPAPKPDTGHDMPMKMIMPDASDSASTKEYKAAMMHMMQSMPTTFTGDADVDFMTQMKAHHQGAIEMVGDVVRQGADLQVNELATSIAADQTAEIDRMRQLLADL